MRLAHRGLKRLYLFTAKHQTVNMKQITAWEAVGCIYGLICPYKDERVRSEHGPFNVRVSRLLSTDGGICNGMGVGESASAPVYIVDSDPQYTMHGEYLLTKAVQRP